MYLKASLLHEFSGKTTSAFSAEGEAPSSVDQDFGDTWAELALGGAPTDCRHPACSMWISRRALTVIMKYDGRPMQAFALPSDAFDFDSSSLIV